MHATLISGDRSLDGEALEQRVLRAAGGLAAWGLLPGEVVAILMRNDFPILEVMLAANRAGILAVPLNWHANADEIAFILEDCAARVLVAHSDLFKAVAAGVPSGCRVLEAAPPPEIRQAYRLSDAACTANPGTVDYEDWLQASAPSTAPPLPAPASLLYTSGTTGRPKGVRRAGGTPEIAAKFGLRVRAAHGQEIRPIRAVLTGPLYHSAPLVYALNSLRFGELLVLQPKFDAGGLLDLVERHRLSHMHVVPTMFSRLLDLAPERRRAFDTSTLKAVTHGAAMCPRDIKQAMIDWWGPVIIEYYAATEIGVIATCTSEEWLSHPGTVGKAPEGVEIAIVDDDEQPVPTGDKGEIFIRCDVADLASYHQRPEAMAELRRGEWLTLGDVGHVDADGFLWISDRKKDMVISGGVNVFPAELEEEALKLPEVRDCVAFGIADRDLGEVLVLAIEPHAGARIDLEKMRVTLTNRLGRLRGPRRVLSMPVLPREDSGKIARRKLKQHYLEGMASSPAAA
ncbi:MULTISPECIES: acyl-CoA synthetase [Burkholderiales]|uniref:Long-chain-fatty-acid--CoA ligase n=2 Tax=Burkholderiales TaxID=80840 RepID=A0A4V1BZU3_9BURK|nr:MULTISPECIES: acyl-CoA synthetase [Burkholderiales]AFK33045.1 acyl-CoA synthetase [Variovorax sp. DB1]QBY56522.1 long-chain-fatty-acid--CoA ligase [Cupriavidus oxalaticus]